MRGCIKGIQACDFLCVSKASRPRVREDRRMRGLHGVRLRFVFCVGIYTLARWRLMALDFARSATFAPAVWLACKAVAAAALYAVAVPLELHAACGAACQAARVLWGAAVLFEHTIDHCVLDGTEAFALLWQPTPCGGNMDVLRDLLAVSVAHAAARTSTQSKAGAVHTAVCLWAVSAAALVVHELNVVRLCESTRVALAAALACTLMLVLMVVVPELAAAIASYSHVELGVRALVYTAALTARVYHASPATLPARARLHEQALPHALVFGWLFAAPGYTWALAYTAVHVGCVFACVAAARRVVAELSPVPAAEPCAAAACDLPAIPEDTLRRMQDMEAALDCARQRPRGL